MIERERDIERRLREAVEKAQKEVTRLSAAGDDIAFARAKKAYRSAMDAYRNDPVVQNFETAKEEMEALLQEAADILR